MDAVLIDTQTAELKEKNLHRSLFPVDSRKGPYLVSGRKKFLDFASNNYLGLSSHPRVLRAAAAALKEWGAGSGASRLLSGDLAVHKKLERELASLKKEEDAAVYSSGYLANLGAVTALVGKDDLVIVDRLNHASLIDAARLSGAKLWVYPHRDTAALDGLLGRGSFRKKLVVTDSYFSMDGTVAPLEEISAVCRRRGAMLLVDEAHATGVYGKKGGGLSEHFGLEGKIDVVMGTLSKALGSVGGFITGSAALKDRLVNHSREFIYTTAPSPAASAAAFEAVRVLRAEPTIRKKLWDNVVYARKKLESLGFDLMGSEGPVIPVAVGGTEKAMKMKDVLLKDGIFAPAIRPPTVPNGTDRIRISITALHEFKHLDRLSAAMKKAGDNS